jgi:imidazolonepropionase-like amidohydrolase
MIYEVTGAPLKKTYTQVTISKRSALILVCLLLVIRSSAQDSSLSARKIYRSATIHTVNGVINNGYFVTENGIITHLGDRYESRTGDPAAVDLNGKHIYPGFIALNTTLGLSEIDAVRATLDYNEVGVIIPNVRAAIAYNTDSRIIPTVRSNGILLAQVTPSGGLVSGSSSVFKMDGWNWEDALYKADDGIHLHWPNMYVNTGWWAEPGETVKKENQKELENLEKFFGDALAYYKAGIPAEINLRLEGAKGLFDRSKNLYVHVDYVKGIIAAVAFAEKFGARLVIVGGGDAWLVTDLLKEKGVSVIITGTHRLPGRSMEDVDLPYKLPYLLQKAGVLYAISCQGAWEQRNLMFNAGTAVAYGLSREEALQAITINPARILGIDSSAGSLAVGKAATYFISSGDALDMRTHNVEAAYINGRSIELRNHQEDLYRKFSEKYR